MRINLHARIELAAVAVLLLASCDGPGLSNKQRDEVGDIAGDVAGDVVSDDSKVRDLESRVEAIEQRLNM